MSRNFISLFVFFSFGVGVQVNTVAANVSWIKSQWQVGQWPGSSKTASLPSPKSSESMKVSGQMKKKAWCGVVICTKDEAIKGNDITSDIEEGEKSYILL